MNTLLRDFLHAFGIQVANDHPPQPGITQVQTVDAISKIFEEEAAAARYASDAFGRKRIETNIRWLL